MRLIPALLLFYKFLRTYISYNVLLLTFFAFFQPKSVYSQGVSGIWNNVGNTGFSAGEANKTTLVIDGSGTPYVAYTDMANGCKASVMKYNGSAWVQVGNAGFTADSAIYPSIAIDGSGTLYVAYTDVVNGNRATVMKYNGSAWVLVGNVGFSAGAAYHVTLAINSSGMLYVAYSDGAYSDKVSVKKYVGNTWQYVGNPGCTASISIKPIIAIDGNGVPYVSYMDYANNQKMCMVKYNGSAWVQVGISGFSAGMALYPSFVLDGNGTPYVAYEDVPNGSKASVMKYNGNAWVQLGLVGFSDSLINYTSLAIDASGTPYVAFLDYAHNAAATVMKYTCNNWVLVGNAGFSTGVTTYTSLAIDGSGTPYVAFKDGVNLGATLMKFTPSSVMPNNIAPTFVSSSPQILTVCQNSTAINIAGLLHVSDMDTSQAESWSQFAAPSHGTLSFTTTTASSGSNNIAPCGSIVYTPNIGYSGTDAFTIKVSDGASMATMLVNVTVTLPVTPAISIAATPTGAVCAGSNVTCTATNTYGGTVPSYQWKKNGINVGTNSSVYTYTPNNGDSVRCIMTSSDVCVSQTTANSNSIVETVNSLLIPTITISVPTGATLGSTVTATATVTNAGSSYTIYWMNHGVTFTTTNVPPASGNSTTYTKGAGTDSITAKVVVTGGGCYDSATTATYTTVTTTVGIDNINNANDVKVYPNPTSNLLHIDNVRSSINYRLQNLVGMTVLQGTFTKEINTLQIQELPNGMYLLQLTGAEGQREVVRVVKE